MKTVDYDCRFGKTDNKDEINGRLSPESECWMQLKKQAGGVAAENLPDDLNFKLTRGSSNQRRKPCMCTICGRWYPAHWNLRRHLLIHTGEKPHQCHYCKRTFALKENLKKHLKVHTGEMPYKCRICQKSFRESGNLKSHMMTHVKENEQGPQG